MACITKRPNGSYQIAIYLGTTPDGKKSRKYLTRKSLKEARKIARELEMTAK